MLAIEHDRNHFDSYVSLAEVYVERYEFKLAKTTLISCLRLNKEHEAAQKAMKHVETLIK